jgi:hypothetical protein
MVFAMSVWFMSCTKSRNTEVNNFTWTFLDTTYVAKSNALYLSGVAATPILVVSDKANLLDTSAARILIKSPSFDEGTYMFEQNGTDLKYTDNQGYRYIDYNGGQGTLTITSFRNNLVSGYFSGVVGVPLTTGFQLPFKLTGIFNNVPVKP